MKEKNKITPIIMAGGNGSRLWPLSRAEHPKQFLHLDGELTMLQKTITRLNSADIALPLVISNNAHRFLVADQLEKINSLDRNIILEPEGKNTAPAVALAALHLLASHDDTYMLVLAADHVIKNETVFQNAITAAISHAEMGKIVAFGVVPSHPETGYGYIRRGEANLNDAYKIDSFVEKPSFQTAVEYFESNEYYWNSGMFLFRASVYLSELKKFRPDIFESCSRAINKTENDFNFIRIDKEEFATCPEDSIDYAIMEHTSLGVVIPIDAGWSDVGSWSMLWEISDKDELGNSINGDVLLHDSNNNYIYTDSGMIATVGIDDLIVINTRDATLIAHKTKDQEVKKIVNTLKEKGRVEYQMHRHVFRPWGKQEIMEEGNRYKVRRITVKPGEKLTTQMHLHRAEHWIVVSGTAKVTVEQVAKYVTENESTFIPVGKTHSLENPGNIPLEIIEIQSGSYLNEDDIIRFN